MRVSKSIFQAFLLMVVFASTCIAEGQYGKLHTLNNLYLWKGIDGVYYMTSWCEEVPQIYKLRCNMKSMDNGVEFIPDFNLNETTQPTPSAYEYERLQKKNDRAAKLTDQEAILLNATPTNEELIQLLLGDLKKSGMPHNPEAKHGFEFATPKKLSLKGQPSKANAHSFSAWKTETTMLKFRSNSNCANMSMLRGSEYRLRMNVKRNPKNLNTLPEKSCKEDVEKYYGDIIRATLIGNKEALFADDYAIFLQYL